jgi:hypothetical protein
MPRSAHATTDHSFKSPEGLRALLIRLQQNGGDSWRADAEAAALMRHAADRYAALARKHGLDPWEAAAAAVDAMRSPSIRRADDPWAMVTRAVQVTCIAEERARGLLCSVHQARRAHYSVFHDAERFSDRENPLLEYHPAFRAQPVDEEPSPQAESVGSAVEDTIALFTLLGWPPDRARTAIEYVCTRLADSPSRSSAFEALRRDYNARALLDVPQRAWTAMLRALLGHPDPAFAHSNFGRGILLRLLVGEPLRALLSDEQIVAEVAGHVPRSET